MSIGAAVEALRFRYPSVSHSSLRFLEREGLLTSTRTGGGHRLYSRSDLERVLLIKDWQKQGMSLDEIRQRLEHYDALPNPSELCDAFMDLAMQGRLEEAEHLLLQADLDGLDPERMFFDVMQPALVRVGDLWEAGALSVHQEKEISEICREVVTEITLRHAAGSVDGPLLIAACVEGERHELGLRMVHGLLRMEGYRMRYLGPDVATRFLLDAIEDSHPDAVLLTATLDCNFVACRHAIEAIRALYVPDSPPPILVGGYVTLTRSEELRSIGAIALPYQQMRAALSELLANT